MPSSAYTTFKVNLRQVDKLLEAFITMRSPTRGRKYLDHFTRAALLFLCSAWEVYIEQVANEAGRIISTKLSKPSELPLPVKKEISSITKKSKHDLSPIELADDWKGYYLTQINEYTTRLNTPKKSKVLELFNKYLGIPGDRINSAVPTLDQVNRIISVRGQVAHNVYAEEYLTKDTVDNYYQSIKQAVIEIDTLLWNYLTEITDKEPPWQNTYN